MIEAADLLIAQGAREVYAATVHAVLAGNAIERLKHSAIRELVTTDTLRLTHEQHWPGLRVLSVAPLLADRCIDGMEADVARCRRYAEASPAIATALNPRIGYEAAARVVKRAVAEGRTIREVVLEEHLLTEAEADEILDVAAMAKGGLRT